MNARFFRDFRSVVRNGGNLELRNSGIDDKEDLANASSWVAGGAHVRVQGSAAAVHPIVAALNPSLHKRAPYGTTES